MALSKVEMAKEAIQTLAQFRTSGDPAIEELVALFYTADPRIQGLITKMEELVTLGTTQAKQEAGYVMESIAVLAFHSLLGWSSLKSYQSAGPQHDLLIEGSGALWQQLCWHFYMLSERRAIVIEAKAISSRLSDPQFARMCAIMDHNLVHAGLGIFLTLNGASGFPARSGPPSRSVAACRLRQVIYFSSTKRPIIVFDREDLAQLAVNGALPLLIHRKVKEIFELTGLPAAPISEWREVVLPAYLQALVGSL